MLDDESIQDNVLREVSCFIYVHACSTAAEQEREPWLKHPPTAGAVLVRLQGSRKLQSLSS